jgi:ATP-dependent DNA helicase RecG
MTRENHRMDRKSLRKICGHAANFSDVAADCVCFANASGGVLLIGFEDSVDEPSSSGEVTERVGKEVPYSTLNRCIDELVGAGPVRHEGQGRWRRYWLTSR